MLSPDKKESFVVMRGAGMTLREIATRISVSERTLKRWGKSFKDDIDEAQKKGLAVAIEAYNMTKADRLKALSDQLSNIWTELKKRDLSSVPSVRLIQLGIAGLALADKIIGDVDESPKDVQAPWDLMADGFDEDVPYHPLSDPEKEKLEREILRLRSRLFGEVGYEDEDA